MKNKLKYPMVLVDTEYTAFGHSYNTAWWKPWQHKEIIQTGAIKLNENKKEVANLNILVKPKINSILSKRFVKLTGISQEKVDKYGISFVEALNKFIEFSKNCNICTYDTDYYIFNENCELNKIKFPFKDEPFIRISQYLADWGIEREKYSSGTLYKAIGEKMDTKVHNALHDVRSMALVVKRYV